MCIEGKFRYLIILNPSLNVGHDHIIGPNSVQCFHSALTRAVNVRAENYDERGVSTAQSGLIQGIQAMNQPLIGTCNAVCHDIDCANKFTLREKQRAEGSERSRELKAQEEAESTQVEN